MKDYLPFLETEVSILPMRFLSTGAISSRDSTTTVVVILCSSPRSYPSRLRKALQSSEPQHRRKRLPRCSSSSLASYRAAFRMRDGKQVCKVLKYQRLSYLVNAVHEGLASLLRLLRSDGLRSSWR